MSEYKAHVSNLTAHLAQNLGNQKDLLTNDF